MKAWKQVGSWYFTLNKLQSKQKCRKIQITPTCMLQVLLPYTGRECCYRQGQRGSSFLALLNSCLSFLPTSGGVPCTTYSLGLPRCHATSAVAITATNWAKVGKPKYRRELSARGRWPDRVGDNGVPIEKKIKSPQQKLRIHTSTAFNVERCTLRSKRDLHQMIVAEAPETMGDTPELQTSGSGVCQKGFS